jgi:very-short-patch-repair endonuclease
MAQPASKVAVEFDGPTHYLAGAVDSSRALDGTSKFKERLLRNLGWKLVRVPYYEWDALRSSAGREAYLRGKIKT